ncbi:nuclear transport factor 2 family protein [Natronosporangium hydrolyticum]|uniref:Nuclear transport factor 2 family protein n=1 Tax=Natronosporangium hydrolyticum TaxID=2811111 RepID=A0A895YP96_9ACTN|nr:nuclear transport factor 2 family protein [Natronosporangium hydrolyticum]QSB15930.1 nuclear transport factor 2 family protein [Natronosporangium hydrolyticum]
MSAPTFDSMTTAMDDLRRLAVASLLDRYLVTLDTEQLDDQWARSLFAPDAVVTFPVGRHEGIGGLAGFHRTALGKFHRTQHMGSPAVVDLAGNRAFLRANLMSTQVKHDMSIFVTGTLARGEAQLTVAGWRLALLTIELVWMTGEPPISRD